MEWKKSSITIKTIYLNQRNSLPRLRTIEYPACLLIFAYRGDACHEFTNNGEERRIGVDSSGWGGGGIFPPRGGCLEGCLWERHRRKSRAAKNEVSSSSLLSLLFPFLSSSPLFHPTSRTVSGNCLCRWNFHARRANKRLNFSTVARFDFLIETNPLAVINAQGMKCKKEKRKENFWIKRNYVIWEEEILFFFFRLYSFRFFKHISKAIFIQPLMKAAF